MVARTHHDPSRALVRPRCAGPVDDRLRAPREAPGYERSTTVYPPSVRKLPERARSLSRSRTCALRESRGARSGVDKLVVYDREPVHGRTLIFPVPRDSRLLAVHVPPQLAGLCGCASSSSSCGLLVFAAGIVAFLESDLGLSPWDVLHQGLADQTPLSFGAANVVVSGVVLGLFVGVGRSDRGRHGRERGPRRALRPAAHVLGGDRRALEERPQCAHRASCGRNRVDGARDRPLHRRRARGRAPRLAHGRRRREDAYSHRRSSGCNRGCRACRRVRASEERSAWERSRS